MARYIAPAGYAVAVLIGLVAMMATGPHLTTLAPRGAAGVAASATDKETPVAVVQGKVAGDPDRVAQLTAENDNLRSKIAALSLPTAEATRQPPPAVDKPTAQHAGMAQHAAPVASPPMPIPRRRDVAPTSRTERPVAREQTARAEPPPQSPPHAMSSISRQLLQARVALVSGDTYGARRMMKEAQTLILFEPSRAAPAGGSGAVSGLTQALMMLSEGNDQRALAYLNEALTAVLPES